MSDQNDNIHTDRIDLPVVILAGGAARRMGGNDKGEILLSGRRLVDHVVDRLLPQTGTIIFSGRHAYELAYPVIEDRGDGPRGPAAGLWAAKHWIDEHGPDVDGFFTVPVDGPFLPHNLLKRLSKDGNCAIAVDDTGDHPTFAYWRLSTLTTVLAQYEAGAGIALRQLADGCSATRVPFRSNGSLMNINTSIDLQHAESLIGSV